MRHPGRFFTGDLLEWSGVSRDVTCTARPFLLAVAMAVVPLHSPVAATAQALPFHTSTGVTAGFNENAARHFLSFVGRSGLVRDGGSVTDPMRRDVEGVALVNGVILGGFTPLWTVRVIVPWLRKEMDFRSPTGAPARFETSGVGDAVFQSKWIFLRDDRAGAATRVGMRGRLKLPLGSTDARLPSGEVAPRPLQVGTGSWDVEPTLIFTNVERRVGIHGNVGGRFNGRDDGFEAGDVFLYDVALGFRFLPWVYESMTDQTVVAYLELDGTISGRDELDGREDPDSGGHLLLVSPALQWIPKPWLLFEGSLQIPVVQALNGTQLEHDTRLQIGTRYRFSIFR